MTSLSQVNAQKAINVLIELQNNNKYDEANGVYLANPLNEKKIISLENNEFKIAPKVTGFFAGIGAFFGRLFKMDSNLSPIAGELGFAIYNNARDLTDSGKFTAEQLKTALVALKAIHERAENFEKQDRFSNAPILKRAIQAIEDELQSRVKGTVVPQRRQQVQPPVLLSSSVLEQNRGRANSESDESGYGSGSDPSSPSLPPSPIAKNGSVSPVSVSDKATKGIQGVRITPQEQMIRAVESTEIKVDMKDVDKNKWATFIAALKKTPEYLAFEKRQNANGRKTFCEEVTAPFINGSGKVTQVNITFKRDGDFTGDARGTLKIPFSDESQRILTTALGSAEATFKPLRENALFLRMQAANA